MTKHPPWWDGKFGPRDVIAWVITLSSAIYMVVFIRADVNALQSFRDDTKREIVEFRHLRQQDREAFLRMEGDIRVIRQILEQQSRPVSGPR